MEARLFRGVDPNGPKSPDRNGEAAPVSGGRNGPKRIWRRRPDLNRGWRSCRPELMPVVLTIPASPETNPERTTSPQTCETNGVDHLIAVRDRGLGVSDDQLAKLGSPFYRTDDSRSTHTGGIGLGLAIARRAIHLHRGALEFSNADPGLRVVIRIPRGDIPEVMRSKPADRRRRPTRRPDSTSDVDSRVVPTTANFPGESRFSAQESA